MNAPLTPTQHDLLSKSERQSQVVRALQADLPSHALIWQAEDTTPYECDGSWPQGWSRRGYWSTGSS